MSMNLKKMMRDAQKMQEKLQEQLADLRVTASAGGGVVTATMNGAKELVGLELDAAVVDPDEIEMLQDLVVAAINEANRRVEEEIQRKVGGMMPAGMGGLGGLMG